jgi:histidine triad (HIT) family protein
MKDDCLFCSIAQGRTDTRFLHEDDEMVVFEDKYPHRPVHLLIVPKRHIRSVNDLAPGDLELVGRMIDRARLTAKEVKIDQEGYKLLFNVERGGGQVIFHLHLHLMSGRRE